MPATGEGISVSTLSVETSRSGSSTATSSPTALSQRVTVPSVTDSPSAGMVTGVPSPLPPEDAGCAGADSAAGSSAGASSAGAFSAAGADSSPASSPASPITASSPPISTVSSSWATILTSTPAAGDGISVSTLSVETSSKGSSTSTVSPSCLSHRVTVPSVTLSPSAGIWTEKAMSVDSSTVVFVCVELYRLVVADHCVVVDHCARARNPVPAGSRVRSGRYRRGMAPPILAPIFR